jgi:hypothetical protein
MPPCAMTTMTRKGSQRCSPRMRNLGLAGSRFGIRTEVFRGAAGIFSFAIHYSLNGRIYVDGDTARAQWYLWGA